MGDGPMTAAYVSRLPTSDVGWRSWERSVTEEPADLGPLWEAGGDIARSLWDHESLIFLIDLDFQSPDDPLEPFRHPAEVFVATEPTYRAVATVLRRYGVDAAPIMTARGYHFTGRIPLSAPVTDRLARLVPDPPAWFHTLSQRHPPAIAQRLTRNHAMAATGLGLLVEFLAHEVLAEAQPGSRLPVVLNGTLVGFGPSGRRFGVIRLLVCGRPARCPSIPSRVRCLSMAPAAPRHLRRQGRRLSGGRHASPRRPQDSSESSSRVERSAWAWSARGIRHPCPMSRWASQRCLTPTLGVHSRGSITTLPHGARPTRAMPRPWIERPCRHACSGHSIGRTTFCSSPSTFSTWCGCSWLADGRQRRSPRASRRPTKRITAGVTDGPGWIDRREPTSRCGPSLASSRRVTMRWSI